MTKTFKCDICGEEIEEIAATYTTEDSCAPWSVHYPFGLKNDALHLCEEHTKEFYEWIKECRRKVNGKNNR